MENATSGVKYEPKFGRVLVRREIREKVGSIILPDAKKHARCVGVIEALGETAGWTDVPNTGYTQTMKVGETVVFGRHAGAWLDATYGNNGQEQDDGTLFICKDEDILAIIR